MDPAAQKNNLLSFSQLQKSVKNSVNRKDKICVIDNKVIVLLVRSKPDSVKQLLNKLSRSLPDSDPEYVGKVIKHISLYRREIDKKIENADQMMAKIFESEKNKQELFIPISEIKE